MLATASSQIRLRKGKKGLLRPGYPWIHKNQITFPRSFASPGDIVTVLDFGGKFIGKGYYNPKSAMAVRLLTGVNEAIDARLFRRRMAEALGRRKGLLPQTNAYRAVFSEADGLPGLIVDIYNGTAVFQVLTLGMERLRGMILDGINEALDPRYIYERSDSPFRETEGMAAVKGWRGKRGGREIEIFEGEAKFIVDIECGHKTGFYLDQRRSRMSLRHLSRGKRALDLFCYTGGFTINAALSGASAVRAVDIKEEWLDMGRRNAALNGAADRIEFVKGDAFAFLEKTAVSGETFDIIVLDPPSFARTRESVESAMRGYRELNLLAMRAVEKGGLLCTFSCSYNVTWELFSGMLKKAAEKAGRKTSIVMRCRQGIDHPIVKAVPETGYLKGYFLRME